MFSLKKFFRPSESGEREKVMKDNIESSALLRHEAKKIVRQNNAIEQLGATIERRGRHV